MANQMYLCLGLALMSVAQVVLVESQPPGIPPQQAQGGHGGPPATGQHVDHQQAHVAEGGSHGEHDWRAGAQNAEHIMEHLDGVMNKSTSDMSEQELQFYYFKLHDYDHNNRLDGLELTKAITHFHGDEDPNVVHQVKPFSDSDITGIVDVILKDDDLDNDGFIEYVEFMTAQQRQRQDAQQQPPAA